MSPAQALAAIVTLGALLAVASATAGALWWRLRSRPTTDRIDEELARRLGALEAILAGPGGRPPDPPPAKPSPPHPAGPKALRRADRAEPTAVAGPTLIAVPDLTAPGDADAAADLGRRFGAIWDLADAGAPADAIARATGQPIGQIELILGLRRRMAAGGRA